MTRLGLISDHPAHSPTTRKLHITKQIGFFARAVHLLVQKFMGMETRVAVTCIGVSSRMFPALCSKLMVVKSFEPQPQPWEARIFYLLVMRPQSWRSWDLSMPGSICSFAERELQRQQNCSGRAFRSLPVEVLSRVLGDVSRTIGTGSYFHSPNPSKRHVEWLFPARPPPVPRQGALRFHTSLLDL